MSSIGWITGTYSTEMTWFLIGVLCLSFVTTSVLPILRRFQAIKPTLLDKRFCLCIDGGTFLEDLAFSHRYHKTTANQILHQVSLISILACLMIIYLKVFPPLILIPYTQFMIYAWIDTVGAFLWHFFFLIAMAVIVGIRIAPHLYLFIACCIAIIVLLLSQLLGHECFEKARPAFRLFELMFTTPLLMIMEFAFHCGYDHELMDKIKKQNNDTK